ncbi:MAG: hypothetical protein ACR2HA_05560 [Nocardioides sp.]
MPLWSIGVQSSEATHSLPQPLHANTGSPAMASAVRDQLHS